VDMKSGRPQVVSKYSTAQNGPDVNTKGVCPAALGSKDQQPAAFDPETKLFYVPTNHVCMDYEPFAVEYTAGQPYVGATLSMYPAPGSHGGMATTSPGMRARARSCSPRPRSSRSGAAR
jgi:lanthanide-dependent methanol dehydrogenase